MRAILSDLDGTLVDSTPAVLRVWQGWMRDRSLPVVPAAEHPHGIPARAVVAMLAPHLDADAEAHELERREIEDVDGVRPLPGAAAVLRAAAGAPSPAGPAGSGPSGDRPAGPPAPGDVAAPLASRAPCAGTPWPRVAVVTSCTRPLALARLTAAGLPLPRTMITSERTARVKPDPDPYLLGAAELGVDPADCVVLEDAPAGIAAGRAAGMRVVAVACSHDARALRDADELFDDVAAFLRAADLTG